MDGRVSHEARSGGRERQVLELLARLIVSFLDFFSRDFPWEEDPSPLFYTGYRMNLGEEEEPSRGRKMPRNRVLKWRG